MRYFIVGGAGFIGSHFTDRLLADGHHVTIFDNFSSGRVWHFEHHLGNPNLRVVKGEVNSDWYSLRESMTGSDVVIHLASNPDIARAASDPTIDFYQGTLLTQQVLEAMRVTGVKQILYASGSGVYGDRGHQEIREDAASMVPVSTYGASKLAGEAMISAYCHMFGMKAWIFRFANVVGPRQSHGVGYDFVRKLCRSTSSLEILGDGSQCKSYIHVDDVIDAVMMVREKVTVRTYVVFNVATGDAITVSQIALMAMGVVGAPECKFNYSGGDRGWKGDIPVVLLNTERIRSIGWEYRRGSGRAMKDSMTSLLKEIGRP